jgi:hypothetical protein
MKSSGLFLLGETLLERAVSVCRISIELVEMVLDIQSKYCYIKIHGLNSNNLPFKCNTDKIQQSCTAPFRDHQEFMKLFEEFH